MLEWLGKVIVIENVRLEVKEIVDCIIGYYNN